ncbi:MAG: NADH-quinone oxidoreductase subunit H [Acidaminococcaceae bacterium]
MVDLGQQVIFLLIQLMLLTLVAPLVSGITKKLKAYMQNRLGASIFQGYYDLAKLWQKPTVITAYTSNIFLAAPFIYLLSVLLAAAVLPLGFSVNVVLGDIFVFISLLAIGRFIMTLSSLDAGTSFGGMGGSRELYISALVEPVMLLAVLSAALQPGTTSIAGMNINYTTHYFTISSALSCCAFFAILLAENGCIPVDNPDTHLELTMIHECMTLEYSGRLLAIIHLASMVKGLLIINIFSLLFFPVNLPLLIKIIITAAAIAVVESLNNKMRLFKVRFYMVTAGVLLLLAIVAQ